MILIRDLPKHGEKYFHMVKAIIGQLMIYRVRHKIYIAIVLNYWKLQEKPSGGELVENTIPLHG